MTTASGPPRRNWRAVLRRQPVRAAERAGSGFAEAYDAYEIICRDCGDDPGLDYREIPPRLQRLRGPYWLAPGVEAYELHEKFHRGLQVAARPRLAALAGGTGAGRR